MLAQVAQSQNRLLAERTRPFKMLHRSRYQKYSVSIIRQPDYATGNAK